MTDDYFISNDLYIMKFTSALLELCHQSLRIMSDIQREKVRIYQIILYTTDWAKI